MAHHIIFNGGELSPHVCTFIQSNIFALHLEGSQSGVLGKIVKTIEVKGGAALKQVTSFLSQVSFDARSDLSRDTKAHFIISLLSHSGPRGTYDEYVSCTFHAPRASDETPMTPISDLVAIPRENVRWLSLHFYTINIVRSQHEIRELKNAGA